MEVDSADEFITTRPKRKKRDTPAGTVKVTATRSSRQPVPDIATGEPVAIHVLCSVTTKWTYFLHNHKDKPLLRMSP